MPVKKNFKKKTFKKKTYKKKFNNKKVYKKKEFQSRNPMSMRCEFHYLDLNEKMEYMYTHGCKLINKTITNLHWEEFLANREK